jgi:hypothetical protein
MTGLLCRPHESGRSDAIERLDAEMHEMSAHRFRRVDRRAAGQLAQWCAGPGASGVPGCSSHFCPSVTETFDARQDHASEAAHGEDRGHRAVNTPRPLTRPRSRRPAATVPYSVAEDRRTRTGGGCPPGAAARPPYSARDAVVAFGPAVVVGKSPDTHPGSNCRTFARAAECVR